MTDVHSLELLIVTVQPGTNNYSYETRRVGSSVADLKAKGPSCHFFSVKRKVQVRKAGYFSILKVNHPFPSLFSLLVSSC